MDAAQTAVHLTGAVSSLRSLIGCRAVNLAACSENQAITLRVVGRCAGLPPVSDWISAGTGVGKAATLVQCYGPYEQCRDRRYRKTPGAAVHADPTGHAVQEGAGEAVRGGEERPQKTAEEIQGR